MRKVKLFFLLTALLAIAQGTWADTKTFTSFSEGINTQSPVTVHCSSVSSNRAKLCSYGDISIIVSAGYTITEVKFRVYGAYSTNAIKVNNGKLSNTNPGAGATVTVSNVNYTQTTLQSKQGDYSINQIEVTYEANTYSISYDANGGTGTTASQTKTHDVTLQLRNNGYSRTGYTFSKWNTQANGKGTNYNAGANYTANAAATMYAQWTVNTYKVRFNGNGNTSGSMSDQNFTYGTAQNLTANGFSKTGHTFAGWATSPTGAKAYNNQQNVNNLTATNGATVNLYAKWTANTYKVKFNGNGSTSGSMSDQNFTYGTAQNLTANAFSKTGYTFAGWATTSTGAKAYDNQQSVNNLTATNGGTFNLHALWSVENYTINYTLNGGTATNPTNYNITTNTFTLNNPTRDGYTFTGWTGSNGSTPQTSVSIEKGSTGNKNYTANWICQAAVDVMNLINAIGTPITLDSKDAIDAARAAYNALTDAQKTEVGNYATLTAAETAYNTLVADHAAADAVIDKINAIGSPITAASQTAIEDARAAYNALTDTQKGYVTNYSELTNAEAALAVVNLINAIGSPITAASQTAIDAARNAYDALSNDQKALVDNYNTLTDAEAALAVVNLINAIGSPITAASQSAIDAAHNAYANLTDDQKALVGNLSALTDAEAALAVVNQIAAIGEVTLSSGSTIADVRAAYDALTNDQQALVGNYATLTAAETAYNTLVTDHAAADAVIDKINAIGSPITAASQTAIEEARAAYEALTDTQKGYVTNYSELTDAEAALAVVNLINAIDDPVVYTTACHDEITGARTAYEALTAEQKALVDATTLLVLTDAEADYDALVADHAAADAVIDLINAIDDPVVYTDACHQEILDARAVYDALSDEQKALVDATTLQKLTDAEADYASLNVDITAKLDPVNDGVYYSTFYDGSRQLQLPANVEAYTATVSGDKMLLKKVAVPGDILPAATAVVLRASQADFTLIPSAASPVSVENNALRGTDVNMEVPSEHCYVLSGADGFVGFYPLSAPYTLSAHKAYIDLDNLPGGANNAPRRLRFVFSEEQTATGMENVQNEETKAQKVMIDGVMYIIRGEHMYDAQGQVIK